MKNFFEAYNKYVKPEFDAMDLELNPPENSDELFHVADETTETQIKESTPFDEEALVERISNALWEKLNANKPKEEEE